MTQEYSCTFIPKMKCLPMKQSLTAFTNRVDLLDAPTGPSVSSTNLQNNKNIHKCVPLNTDFFSFDTWMGLLYVNLIMYDCCLGNDLQTNKDRKRDRFTYL